MARGCGPQLKRELTGHDVSTVREMAWNGLKNDVLLRRAIVVLTLPNNRLATMRFGFQRVLDDEYRLYLPVATVQRLIAGP